MQSIQRQFALTEFTFRQSMTVTLYIPTSRPKHFIFQRKFSTKNSGQAAAENDLAFHVDLSPADKFTILAYSIAHTINTNAKAPETQCFRSFQALFCIGPSQCKHCAELRSGIASNRCRLSDIRPTLEIIILRHVQRADNVLRLGTQFSRNPRFTHTSSRMLSSSST